MFETCDAHVARAAHRNRHLGAAFVTLVGEKDRRIQTLTGTLLPP